jgi:hypothetical protein
MRALLFLFFLFLLPFLLRIKARDKLQLSASIRADNYKFSNRWIAKTCYYFLMQRVRAILFSLQILRSIKFVVFPVTISGVSHLRSVPCSLFCEVNQQLIGCKRKSHTIKVIRLGGALNHVGRGVKRLKR